MGQRFSTSFEDYFNPKTSPRADRPATFDPLYGFPNGRKPREIKATWEEMERLNIPVAHRDYCVDCIYMALITFYTCDLDYIPLAKCVRATAPFSGYYCNDIRHDWNKCGYEDWLNRAREYEREKRLLKRKLRKERAAAVGEDVKKHLREEGVIS